MDDTDVYPRHVCKACDTQLTRLRQWKANRRGKQPVVPSDAKWERHGENCIICQHKDPTIKRPAETDSTIEPSRKTFTDSQEVYSIDPSRAVDKKMVEKIICSICRGIPTFEADPVLTSCGHVFCKNCIVSWIKIRNTCPCCREEGIAESNLVSIQVFLSNILSGVELRCIYNTNGCLHVCKASNVIDLSKHELLCTYKKNPDEHRRLYVKRPLIACESRYVRSKRLKEISQVLKNMCRDKNEVLEDVLFFLLKDNIDTERAAAVQAIWHSNHRSSLNSRQSLALKVGLKLSDTNYLKLFRILKEHLPVPSVVSLEKVKEEMKHFMPNAVTFQVYV